VPLHDARNRAWFVNQAAQNTPIDVPHRSSPFARPLQLV
jgi:hypothetical protein